MKGIMLIYMLWKTEERILIFLYEIKMQYI